MAIDPPYRLSPFENIVNISFGGAGFMIGGQKPLFVTAHAEFSQANGTSWADASPTLTDPSDIVCITFGAGLWVTAGYASGSSTPYLATATVPVASVGGKLPPWKWQTQATPFTNQINGVAYGKGSGSDGKGTGTVPLFIAGDEDGNIAWSTDAQSWTLSTTFPESVKAVAFLNGLFFASTSYDSPFPPNIENYSTIYASNDGKTWNAGAQVLADVQSFDQFGALIVDTGEITGFAYGGGVYVAIGQKANGSTGEGTSTVKKRAVTVTSTDGIIWSSTNITTQYNADATGANGNDGFFGIAYSQVSKIFVGVGLWTEADTLKGHQIATSPDGANWTVLLPVMSVDGINTGQLNSVAYSNAQNVFVAAGEYFQAATSSQVGKTFYSKNGTDWTEVVNGFSAASLNTINAVGCAG